MKEGIILEDPPLPAYILKLVNIKKYIIITLLVIILMSIGFIIYGQNITEKNSKNSKIVFVNNTIKTIKQVYNFMANITRTESFLMVLAYCGLFCYFKNNNVSRKSTRFVPVGIHAPPIFIILFAKKVNYFGGVII